MKFGKLDRRIRFLKRSPTQNPYGDPVPAWNNLDAADSSLGEVWAEVIFPGSPKETPQAYGIFPERHITFNIRDPRGSFTILDNFRVDYSGEDYDVIGIQEIGRLDGLRVFCKRVQTD